jgi:hypothetical protein
MTRNKMNKEQAKERSLNWWYCDNNVNPHHSGQIGLMHLGSPTVFILIRDSADICFCSYEEFSEHIAEVNFLYPEERKNANIEELLIDAWNFMALSEEADEEACEEFEQDW